MEECKRCLLFESHREDTLKVIREHIEKAPESQKVDKATYLERLELCRQCEHLISGVCIKCGCYVEFRAAFSGQKCPNPKDRKW